MITLFKSAKNRKTFSSLKCINVYKLHNSLSILVLLKLFFVYNFDRIRTGVEFSRGGANPAYLPQRISIRTRTRESVHTVSVSIIFSFCSPFFATLVLVYLFSVGYYSCYALTSFTPSFFQFYHNLSHVDLLP